MLRMSQTSTTQKLMNLVDEFARGDCGENEARRAFASKKRPIGADYPSSNHVSYTVSNIVSHTISNIVSNSAKNVSIYPTPDTRRAFDQLCQAFTKAPILQHFDPEWYIRVETVALEHAIGGVLSQLTNDLGQWLPMAYFLCKMILAKTQYKTHNRELLAIIEAFKTWRHYL